MQLRGPYKTAPLVVGLARSCQKKSPIAETSKRARHGIRQPVLARGDSSGVGERGHSIHHGASYSFANGVTAAQVTVA